MDYFALVDQTGCGEVIRSFPVPISRQDGMVPGTHQPHRGWSGSSMHIRPLPHHAAPASQETTGEWVLSGEVLDQWLARSWDDGVRPDQLASLELLPVQTRNSSYELAIMAGCDGHVLVRGGRYFREWTPVYFLGCSLGGALLKRHSLHPGLRMEFGWGGRRVITSPVCSIGWNTAGRPSAAS